MKSSFREAAKNARKSVNKPEKSGGFKAAQKNIMTKER